MATGTDSTPWIAKKSLLMNEPFICHIYRNTRKIVQSPSKPLIVHSGLSSASGFAHLKSHDGQPLGTLERCHRLPNLSINQGKQ